MVGSRWSKPKYLPFNAILNYWCGDDEDCMEVKKYNLIQACEQDEVKYNRRIHTDLTASVVDLFANDNLLINLESFEGWAARGNGGAESSVSEDSITDLSKEEYEWWNDPRPKMLNEDNSFQDELDKDVEAQKKLDEDRKRAEEMEAVENESINDEAFENSRKPATPSTYELIIAVLDECLRGKYKDNDFGSDRKLRDFLVDIYGDIHGISASSLNHVISSSRNRLKRKYDPKENEIEILEKHHVKIKEDM